MLADGVAKSDELCDTQNRHAVYGREYGRYFSLLYLIDGGCPLWEACILLFDTTAATTAHKMFPLLLALSGGRN